MKVRIQRRKGKGEEQDYDHIRILTDDDDRVCESVDDVAKVVSDVSFAPSCVDMGWEFEVEEMFVNVQEGFRTHRDSEGTMQAVEPAGYRLRTTFRRPERTTGVLQTREGRWWEVPLKVTESGVVKTVFAAAKLILEHELMESFKWKSARVFDPHHSIRELASIQAGRYTMSIP